MALPLRLVAFDMEGCLTDDPTVWEIMHRRLGTWDSHGRPYWDSYRRNELGYDEFARMDEAGWRGRARGCSTSRPPKWPSCRGVRRRSAA